MKPHGRLENWYSGKNHWNTSIFIRGDLFDHELPHIDQGGRFTFNPKTEPPFFKTRIVVSHSDRFYLLGEPLNKEDNLV